MLWFLADPVIKKTPTLSQQRHEPDGVPERCKTALHRVLFAALNQTPCTRVRRTRHPPKSQQEHDQVGRTQYGGQHVLLDGHSLEGFTNMCGIFCGTCTSQRWFGSLLTLQQLLLHKLLPLFLLLVVVLGGVKVGVVGVAVKIVRGVLALRLLCMLCLVLLL